MAIRILRSDIFLLLVFQIYQFPTVVSADDVIASHPTTSLVYKEGDSAIFECPIHVAKNSYGYFWFDPNQVIVPNDNQPQGVHLRTEVINSSIAGEIPQIIKLIFIDLRISDTGQYTCSGTDERGVKTDIKKIVSITVLPPNQTSESNGVVRNRDIPVDNVATNPDRIEIVSTKDIQASTAVPVSEPQQKVGSMYDKIVDQIQPSSTELAKKSVQGQPVYATDIRNENNGKELESELVNGGPSTVKIYNSKTLSSISTHQLKQQTIPAETTLRFIYESKKTITTMRPSNPKPSSATLNATAVLQNRETLIKSFRDPEVRSRPESAGAAQDESFSKSVNPTEMSDEEIQINSLSGQQQKSVVDQKPSTSTSLEKTSKVESVPYNDNGVENGMLHSNVETTNKQLPVAIKGDRGILSDTGIPPDNPIIEGKQDTEIDGGSQQFKITTETGSEDVRLLTSAITTSLTTLPTTSTTIATTSSPTTTTTTIARPTPTSSTRRSTTANRPVSTRAVMVTFDEDYDSIIPDQLQDSSGIDGDENSSDLLKANSAGLLLGIALAVVVTGVCAAVVLYRLRSRRRKSKYIAFGNPSYSRDHLPANDLRMDHPLTLSSHGYTVLA